MKKARIAPGPSCLLVRKGGLEPPRYCYRQPLELEDVVTVDGRPRKIAVGCHASWPTVAHRRRASWRRLQILAERTRRGRPALTLKRARRFGSPEQGSHLGGQGRFAQARAIRARVLVVVEDHDERTTAGPWVQRLQQPDVTVAIDESFYRAHDVLRVA